ncbi:hypothetical protein [Agarivorans albus]|uniref:hypothetical protein n=1 Tax=Agarivorans albus TaxID=182262 RepID=UPI00058F702F|nr:hypothetical protein [Agarivorans albus]
MPIIGGNNLAFIYYSINVNIPFFNRVQKFFLALKASVYKACRKSGKKIPLFSSFFLKLFPPLPLTNMKLLKLWSISKLSWFTVHRPGVQQLTNGFGRPDIVQSG